MSGAVRQLRLVVEADDYDATVAFYRDMLGLAEEEASTEGPHITVFQEPDSS